jgi:transposase
VLQKIAAFNYDDVAVRHSSCEQETRMTKGRWKIGDGARVDIPASECEIERSTGLPYQVKDKRGVRQGRLVAQEFAGFQVAGGRRRVVWLCVCDCGNTICVRLTPQDNALSCGCLRRGGHTTHGSKTGEWDVKTAERKAYRVWQSQLHLYSSPDSSIYPTVGGRGIKMCDRWVNDFAAFLEDVGLPPTSDHVLARLDDDKDVEPSNVRWIPRAERDSNQQKYRDNPRPSDDQLRMLAQQYPDATLEEYCDLLAQETGSRISQAVMSRRFQKLGLSRKDQRLSDDQLLRLVKEYPDASISKYCELLAATGKRISKTTLRQRFRQLEVSLKDQRSVNSATAQSSPRMTQPKYRIGDGYRIDIPASECDLELSTGLPHLVKDKRGVRKGRLVFQEFAGFQVSRSGKSKRTLWFCLCDCGNTTCTRTPSNSVASCGCLHHEVNTTHGASNRRVKSAETQVYGAWLAQINRCYAPGSDSYASVGGRGIKMYDPWVKDFPAFLADVGLPPTPAHVLARIDYDKDFEPSNVRWIPKTVHRKKVIFHSSPTQYQPNHDKPQLFDDQLIRLVQKYPDATVEDYCELLTDETGIPITKGSLLPRLRKLGLSKKPPKVSNDQLLLLVQQDPDASAADYCKLLVKMTGIQVSPGTVGISLKKLGLSKKEQRLARFTPARSK